MSVRSAQRLVFIRSENLRSTPDKSVCDKFALVNINTVRFFPERFEFEKFVLSKLEN